MRDVWLKLSPLLWQHISKTRYNGHLKPKRFFFFPACVLLRDIDVLKDKVITLRLRQLTNIKQISFPASSLRSEAMAASLLCNIVTGGGVGWWWWVGGDGDHKLVWRYFVIRKSEWVLLLLSLGINVASRGSQYFRVLASLIFFSRQETDERYCIVFLQQLSRWPWI